MQLGWKEGFKAQQEDLSIASNFDGDEEVKKDIKRCPILLFSYV